MKNLSTLTLLLLFFLGLSSCKTNYYAPGLYQNDVQLMQKPHSKDSLKTRIYASGVLSTQSGAGGQGTSTSGLLNIYRSHTIPHFNFSYGVLGYAGDYYKTKFENNVNSTILSKGFLGYGFNGSTSFYVSTKQIDFRLIGVDLIYTHEGGDFLAYRRSVAGQPDVLSATQAGMFTYAIFTEMYVRSSDDINFGFKFFVSKVTGDINRRLNNIGATTAGTTGYFGYKHFTIQNTIAFGTTNGSLAAATQLGVGYKF